MSVRSLRHIKIPPGQSLIHNFPIPLPQSFTVIECLSLMAVYIFLDQTGHREFYGIALFFFGIQRVVLFTVEQAIQAASRILFVKLKQILDRLSCRRPNAHQIVGIVTQLLIA